MPDLIKFSDLKTDHPLQLDGANDLIALASYTQQGETGYTSMTTTPNQLGAHAVESMTFANLQTTNKTVEGAINEVKTAISGSTWTDLTATLVAGNTTVTIQNAAIKTTSLIQIFTDPELEYNSQTVTTGQIVIAFDAQQSDVGIVVRVSEVAT